MNNSNRLRIFDLLGHFRWWLRYLVWPVMKTKFRQPMVLRRVRAAAKVRKLRVMFVVGATSKWRCQSVYDLMAQSENFEPFICLIICDSDLSLPHEKRLELLARNEAFFKDRKMNCVLGYKTDLGGNFSLGKYSPDLVFYSQPWDVEPVSAPEETARFSLPFYVQYYVTLCETTGSIHFASYSPFYRHFYCYFTQTEELARLYKSYQGLFSAVQDFVGVGNPVLDLIRSDMPSFQKPMIIFAPHWTIPVPGEKTYGLFSTFLTMGEDVLSYAEAHLEISWVFKPHPSLRPRLEKVWSKDRIEQYFARWERVGIVCLSGDYTGYFNGSVMLLTDSLSFLYEYACTGRPIVRLIPKNFVFDAPSSMCGKLFGTYYNVRTTEELVETVKMILEEGRDPNRDSRIALAKEFGLMDNKSGEKIVDYLKGLLLL